jgi:UDP-glucuronate decarboxylase
MNQDEILGPVNLGDPDEVTVLKLAQTIIKITGSTSKLVHTPFREDDPMQRKPDIGLAQTRLDWRPTIDLGEGLERTVGYFRERISR